MTPAPTINHMNDANMTEAEVIWYIVFACEFLVMNLVLNETDF